MIDTFAYSVCLIALLIGSYTDLKTREVPDWISYSLIFIGLGIRAIYSFIEQNPLAFLEGLIGFLIFLGFAFAMFYAGQWGGGDAKVLMGLGALIGIKFSADLSDIFLISFLINTALAGAFYGLLWSIYLAVKHWKPFSKKLRKIISKKDFLRVRRYVLISALILLIIAFFPKDIPLKIAVIIIALFTIITLYLWAYIKAVEESAMNKLVSPEQLTEGDWIVKDIKIGKKIICGPKDLGISSQQIKQLIKLKQKGKIRQILIKEGIPFIPSFLFGFVITWMFGNVVLLFI